MRPVHYDEDGYEHRCKFSVGEWVAFEFPGGRVSHEPKPGKVEEIRWDDETDEDGMERGWVIKVRFRFSEGEKSLWFDRGLRRMRWQRSRGKNRIVLL